MYDQLLKEIAILTSRSSGPGGQHVNKTESRVELHWNIHLSKALKDEEKDWIRERIGQRFSPEGDLKLVCQKSRSQLKNREEIITRFLALIEKNRVPIKKRRATKPSKASIEKRLKNKKAKSDLKKGRGKVDPEG